MERLPSPDLPEDDPQPPDTEPGGLLQLPPGGPPTTLATDLMGSGPEWEDSDFQYGGRIGVIGRAARAVLALIVLVAAFLLPGPWQLKLVLIGVGLSCVWTALFAEDIGASVRRGWHSLQRRRHERRLTKAARTPRRAA